MSHFVNLSDLQQLAAKYLDPSDLAVAGGPLAAAGLVRTFFTKNKIAGMALAGSTIWFGVKTLAGPVNYLIQDQFGSLQSVFGSLR